MSKPRRPRSEEQRADTARRALRRAHRQVETGQHAQAYPAFKRLADSAARDGMPVRAALLYAQAARARVEMAAPGAHNAAWDAVALGQRALRLLSGAGRTAQAHALLARMLELLESKRYYVQSVELRAEGTALLGARTKVTLPQAALPFKCPGCNAPLRADEVEWIDAQSAACAYCGSIVQAG